MNESVETERPNSPIVQQAVGAVAGVAIVVIGLRVTVEVQRRLEARRIRNADKTSAIQS
jgi:hypothetical protein